MNSIQITAFQPAFGLINAQHSQNAPFRLCVKKSFDLGFEKSVSLLKSRCLRLRLQTSLRRYSTPVCLFGNKGKPDSDNVFNPFESVGKAFESIKENLKEDSGKAAKNAAERERQLREMEEFNGDDGKGRGDSGGGGGDGGEPDDDDEYGEDEGWDETFQVLASWLLLIYVYRLIVDGEVTIALTKDIIKLIFLWKPSDRLKLMSKKTKDLFEACIPDNIYIDPDPHWLEHAILSTRTDWNGPLDIRKRIKSYGKSDTTEPEVTKPEVKKPLPKKVEKEVNDDWGDGIVIDRGFSDDEDDEDSKILEENQNENVEMQVGPTLEYDGVEESDASDEEPAEMIEADGEESGEMIEDGETMEEDDDEVSEYDSEKNYSDEDNSDFEYDDDEDALVPEMEEVFGPVDDSSEDDDDEDEDDDSSSEDED